jgi:hypothetical protein
MWATNGPFVFGVQEKQILRCAQDDTCEEGWVMCGILGECAAPVIEKTTPG